MTQNETQLRAGEWINFRGVKAFECLSETDLLLVRLHYVDGSTEVVQLYDLGQLEALQNLIVGLPHPAAPVYESRIPWREAGAWVNDHGVVSYQDGPGSESKRARILVLTYDDGQTESVEFTPEQAVELIRRVDQRKREREG